MLPQAIHQIKQTFAPMRKRADHDAAHPFTMIEATPRSTRIGSSSNALGAGLDYGTARRRAAHG